MQQNDNDGDESHVVGHSTPPLSSVLPTEGGDGTGGESGGGNMPPNDSTATPDPSQSASHNVLKKPGPKAPGQPSGSSSKLPTDPTTTTTSDPSQTASHNVLKKHGSKASGGQSSPVQSSTVTLANYAGAPPPPAIPLATTNTTSKSDKRQSRTPIHDLYSTKPPVPPRPSRPDKNQQSENNPFGDQNQVRGQTPQPVDTQMVDLSTTPISMPQAHPTPDPNTLQQSGGNMPQPNQPMQGVQTSPPAVSSLVSTGGDVYGRRGMYNPATVGAVSSRKPPSRSSSLNTTTTNVSMPNANPTGSAVPPAVQYHSSQSGGALNSQSTRPAPASSPAPRSGPRSNHGHGSTAQPAYTHPYAQAQPPQMSAPPPPQHQTPVYTNPAYAPAPTPPAPVHPEVHMELMQQQRRVINFYNREDPYYEFTNFSPDRVMYNGRDYPTSEHAFQAQKFLDHRPGLAEHIRTYSDNPRDAFNEARRFQPEWRTDWHSIKIQKMEEILYEKFARHPRLRRMLTETDDAELIEDSPHDPFWGIGRDRKGENQLGIALMKLRDKLQADDAARAAKRNNYAQQQQPQYYNQPPANYGQHPMSTQQQTMYAQNPVNPQQQQPVYGQNMQPQPVYSNQMTIQQTPSSYPVPMDYTPQTQGMGGPPPNEMYGYSS
ncbi:hypothetical protein FRC17_005945 [Serendipita sp. 399]|nr:hypothetical protein FRC17_005945 [Serendipita sp. 399]